MQSFDELAKDVLTGAYPYGFLPGELIPDRYALVLVHDEVPSATFIFAMEADGPVCALEVRGTVEAVERVERDCLKFVDEMHTGSDGAMLPFSFLPRRLAMRRLRGVCNVP